MAKYGIPTAEYKNFTDPEEALKYLETASFPIVLKADGLALGKGVLICNTLEEAKDGVKQIMQDKLSADEVLMSGSGPSIVAYYRDSNKASEDMQLLAELTGDMPGVRMWLSDTGN
jgi:phosphoribosylamine-glycine ligase